MAIGTIRFTLLQGVVVVNQLFPDEPLGQASWVDCTDVHDAVITIASTLPKPRNHAESVIVRSLLSDYAWQSGSDIHRRLHSGHEWVSCDFVPAAFLEQWHTRSTEDPRQVLVSWADTFFPALLAHHPPSPAQRAARIIRHQYQQSWTASRLAHRLAVGVAALHREFKAEFGISIHTYQRVVRTAAALEQIRTASVEAVAMAVGYRSKKDLYRALRQLTGFTPRAIRAMSPEAARDLVEIWQLKARTAGGVRKTI